MSRIGALLTGVRERIELARLRQWRREDGPGPVLRWSCRHPWAVTGTLALLLTVILGFAFGIPPLSPLVLVFVFIAPVPWWLSVERRIYERWLEERPPPTPE